MEDMNQRQPLNNRLLIRDRHTTKVADLYMFEGAIHTLFLDSGVIVHHKQIHKKNS